MSSSASVSSGLVHAFCACVSGVCVESAVETSRRIASGTLPHAGKRVHPLHVGLRGDYENKRGNLRTFPAPLTASDRRKGFADVSPQLGLAYHFTPAQMIYANVGRGYKAGGFNPNPPAGSESYGRESSWSYEAGIKTSWWDDRLSLNLAAFYINWKNLQLNQPNGLNYYIANAGAADSKGVELQLNARLLAGWDLFGGFGYVDARILNGATAMHTDAFGVNTAVNVGGRHLIYAPDFTANAGTQYSWRVGRQATLYARAEVDAYGHYFYNPINTGSQSAYTLANFRAGVRGKHWFAEGWVKNAFNTHYVPIALEYPDCISGFVGESGAPVTFGLRAGLSF